MVFDGWGSKEWGAVCVEEVVIWKVEGDKGGGAKGGCCGEIGGIGHRVFNA